MKNKTPWKCALLLSGMSLFGSAMASSGGDAAPRPEQFQTYSQYLQALFDYKKAQAQGGQAEKQTCNSRSQKDQDKEQPVRLDCKDQDIPQAIATENLDEAIEKASQGANPGYVDSSHTRSTSSSFPLKSLSLNDMGTLTVDGLLGLFSELTLNFGSGSDNSTSRMRPGSPLNLDPNNTAIDSPLDQALNSILASADEIFGGIVILPNGSGTITVGRPTATRDLLSFSLSSDIRTGIYIVDRDGMPGTSYSNAGAVVIDSVGINITDLAINMQRVNTPGTNGFGINMSTPNAINVDLSGTQIGAADAVRDGSRIGTSTNFLRFGQDSVLRIAPGMSMETTVSRPNGLNSPFVTLNGNIDSISLNSLSLMDTNSGGAIGIGRFGISGLNFRNTMIYINDKSLVVDTGTGMNNINLSLERISIGDSSKSVGDVYVQHMVMNNNRMTITPH